MTPKLVRAAGLMALLLAASAPAASGATDAEIKKAIKGGTDALKARYAKGVPEAGESHGVGDACLTGLALLEGGVPPDDPVMKLITDRVRDASYKQSRTYQVALCVMYLDRLGNPADVPLIQMLAVRLLVGQTPSGGWDYICIQAVGADDERLLRGMTANQPAGKLHPEVERYGQALTAARGTTVATADDNSNTQFGVLATWMARKHGVPVEEALRRIEERFTTTQNQRGSWPYSGGAAGGLMANAGSPSMYCSGLLGMATGLARREDRKLKAENPDPKKTDPKKTDPKPDPNAGDPFYNPPALGAKPDPKQPARPTGPQDRVIQFAFTGLGQVVAEQVRSGKGLLGGGQGDGYYDLYFLWSLERVGVVYDLDKIGGVDWYDVGSTALVRAQNADGTWPGSYGTDVNTSFAVLFLCKSNLARDLSSKVKKESNTEMRAGAATGAPVAGAVRPPSAGGSAVINLPNPTNDPAVTLGSKLLKAGEADWGKLLTDTRDAKGPNNTRALVLAATHTDGDRKREAREALAERLCRMTPATLRAMLKSQEIELRRAATLACAMKDDAAHIPDLVAMMDDADGSVVRAARAGLKSLTGKDLTTPAEWREWYASEKK